MMNKVIIEHLQRVINKILFMKKKSLFEFRDVSFYPSEIHLMLVIKEKCAINATKIAEQLNVTKGAISQTLSRLEKKGVLVKTKDVYNKNELTLTFTKFGREAFKHYKVQITEIFDKHDRALDSYTDSEKGIIQRFLDQVENMIDEL